MKIEAIIEQAEQLIGQEIEVEGYILILEEAKHKIVYVSSSEEISEEDHQQIFIEHSLAELKTIIRPLPTMQLMFRGVLMNPPYFYNFKAKFRATVDRNADNDPILRDISQIEITIPYAGKMADISLHDNYHYSASVDYTPTPVEEEKRTARAVVKSQKNLLLAQEEVTSELISQDENRYARRMTNRAVRLSGWLESAPSKNDIIKHILFSTTAIRASMVAVGPLRDETFIWIRPGNIYKLLKAHIPLKPGESLYQAVEIIGEVDYLQDDNIPELEDKSPKLVFTNLYSVIIHEKMFLL